MQLEDLTRDDFEPNHLPDEDRVRFGFAEDAYATGNICLAELILSGGADDYAPMRWPLFLANRTEHPREFLVAWKLLTCDRPPGD